jgi:hypothetical protein
VKIIATSRVFNYRHILFSNIFIDLDIYIFLSKYPALLFGFIGRTCLFWRSIQTLRESLPAASNISKIVLIPENAKLLIVKITSISFIYLLIAFIQTCYVLTMAHGLQK